MMKSHQIDKNVNQKIFVKYMLLSETFNPKSTKKKGF